MRSMSAQWLSTMPHLEERRKWYKQCQSGLSLAKLGKTENDEALQAMIGSAFQFSLRFLFNQMVNAK